MLKTLLVLWVLGLLANYGWSRYKATRDADARSPRQMRHGMRCDA